ncbi:MAG: hypothetical protein HON47_00085, partial [Candidatus Diapherotrites archaeon]|nr:hypothetical protein [Candidatus Diapherotrites archaeon]
ISVLDAVVDGDGDGLFALKNNSTDAITLTKITVSGVDSNYNNSLFFDTAKNFVLNNLGDYCSCDSGDARKVCPVTIYYTTVNGISKNETLDLEIDCVDNVGDSNDYVDPTELDVPVILLSSAVGSDSVFTFSYVVDDNSDVSGCDLILNGVVDQTDSSSPFDFFVKSYMSPQVTSWDVNCTDEHGNEGTGVAESIDSSGPYYLTNCLDLDAVRNYLDANHVMLNDINCYGATHSGGDLWNSGSGFDPIGSSSNKFTGDYNGDNKIITGLFINRPTRYSTPTAIFAYSSDASFYNVGIENGSVTGRIYSASFVGDFNDSDAYGVYNLSTVHNGFDSSNTGGLFARCIDSNITNSYNSGDVNGKFTVGGICATANSTSIQNSYNSGTIMGITRVGGVLGSVTGGSELNNVYNSGRIYSPGNFYPGSDQGSKVGGLVGFANDIIINNSYSSGEFDADVIMEGGAFIGCSEYSTIRNSFATGNVILDGGGFAGRIFFGGGAHNIWRYNSSLGCCGDCSNGWADCTKSNGISDFYASDQNVYVEENPNWTFETDANWSNCSNTMLPWLSWEERTC